MYSYNIELEAVFEQMLVIPLDLLHRFLGGDAAFLNQQGDRALDVGLELAVALEVGIRLLDAPIHLIVGQLPVGVLGPESLHSFAVGHALGGGQIAGIDEMCIRDRPWRTWPWAA